MKWVLISLILISICLGISIILNSFLFIIIDNYQCPNSICQESEYTYNYNYYNNKTCETKIIDQSYKPLLADKEICDFEAKQSLTCKDRRGNKYTCEPSQYAFKYDSGICTCKIRRCII